MSRLTNSALTQAMTIGILGMIEGLMEGHDPRVIELNASDEPTERQKAEIIQRREAHERERRADAEKWQREYDAKAQTFRDERAARKAAAFAKRQPKR